MKKNSAFLFTILPFMISLVALLILRLNSDISLQLFDSFFWGFLIPLINFTAGYFFNRAGLQKSDKLFLALVLGGLVFRMFLTLVLIIIVLKFLNVSMYSFIFTVFISYIYFLIIEIINLSGKKPNT
ncbi:MAG: hypothetical protein KGZ85_16185 [Ignavibacterium sp.]|nr:hypothetical protein [Ignavibacterium sp.]